MAALISDTLIYPRFEVALHSFEHIDGNVGDGLADVVLQVLQGPGFVVVNDGFEISP